MNLLEYPYEKRSKGYSIKIISMNRNFNLFSIKSLTISIRAFVFEFHDVRLMMISLAHERQKKLNKRKWTIIPYQLKQGCLNIIIIINITFNQSLFKRKLTHIFTNEFIMSIPMKKEARVTQSKKYPKPGLKDDFGVTYLISQR